MILRSATGVLTEYAFTVSGRVVMALDRNLFRSPFGSAWFTSGSGVEEPVALDLRIEVPESLDPFGADDVDSVLADLNNAVFVQVPFFQGRVVGVERVVVQPVARGYRLDVRLALDRVADRAVSFPFLLASEAGEVLAAESGDFLMVE